MIDFLIFIIVPLGSVIIASTGSWMVIRSSRDKLKVEGFQILVDTALSLIAPLETRVDQLESGTKQLDHMSNCLRLWAGELTNQLYATGITPIQFQDVYERLCQDLIEP